MWLNVVWYILFVVIIAGYLILDGFDLGVGILHMALAKSDHERRVILNSIGPVWDGNEVWLVVGGGVLFAAFPPVYASLFSGFYGAMMLVLLFLILRTVAIEFRSKRPAPSWRRLWDVIFFVSSFAIALLLGVAFGNIITGVPLDAQGVVTGPIPALLTPFALLVGVTTVAMMAMHGGIYLTMKTEGELQARIRRWLPRLMLLFFVLNTLTVAATVLMQQHITERYFTAYWLAIFPFLALVAMLTAWWMLRRGRDFEAFIASGAVIAFLLIAAAAGLFPDLLTSTTDPAATMTIFNSAAAPNSLTIMLIMAVIGMPFVLMYTAGVYYFFRGKTQVGPRSY